MKDKYIIKEMKTNKKQKKTKQTNNNFDSMVVLRSIWNANYQGMKKTKLQK
jgi:hypothetical protein